MKEGERMVKESERVPAQGALLVPRSVTLEKLIS